MNRVTQLIKEDIAKKRQYFCEAEREIAEKNLHLLKILSLVTAALLLFFYALTPFILRGWIMTPQHFFFLPTSLLLYLIALEYRKRGSADSRIITGLCLLFEAVLFTFIILIDVLPYPDAPSSFMPVICIALPALFILPFHLTYAVILFFESIYIAAVVVVKTPFIGQHDIFDSVVGVVFSVAVGQVIMRLRIHDHQVRMKYQQLSTQDFLSGILNKKSCGEAAETYLSAWNPYVTCMLIMLDIDDFKCVNDKLGHYTGDVLLRSIGHLLLETFRATDIVGRFGGDEFMVLIKDASDYSSLEEKCRTVQEKLSLTEEYGHTSCVTCSIGGILVHEQEVDFSALFRQADDALYEAKRTGKNRYILRPYRTL